MAESTETSEKTGRTVMIAMDGSKHAIYAFESAYYETARKAKALRETGWRITRANRYAENIYRPTDNVIMAHCAEHGVHMLPTALMAGSTTVIQDMIKEHEDEVMKTFKMIDELANKHNIKHTLERLNGPPGEALVKAAEQQNVEIIITGSRGHGTIRRTIMGSTSDYVLHHAHVPVLICKHADEHKKMK